MTCEVMTAIPTTAQAANIRFWYDLAFGDLRGVSREISRPA